MIFNIDDEEIELDNLEKNFFNKGSRFNFFYINDSYFNKNPETLLNELDENYSNSDKLYVIYNGELLFKTSYFIIKLIEALIKKDVSFEVVNIPPCYLQDYLNYSFDFLKYNNSELTFENYYHFEDCKYCFLKNKCPGGQKRFEKDVYALTNPFELPEFNQLKLENENLSGFNFDYIFKKYLRNNSRVFIRTNIEDDFNLIKLKNFLEILSEKNDDLSLNLKWVILKNKNKKLKVNGTDFSFKFKSDILKKDILQTYKINSNYSNFKIDKHLFLTDFIINFDLLTFLPSNNAFKNIVLSDFINLGKVNLNKSNLFSILSKISFNLTYDKSKSKFFLFKTE
ncbi:MAG: hypothetical protein ACOCRX_04355 [Candidatus Woesearchaeota archaeon]